MSAGGGPSEAWKIAELVKRKRKFSTSPVKRSGPIVHRSWRAAPAEEEKAKSEADLEVERVRAERERKWKESEERKKREAREEREKERVRKLSRGSGRLTQWFGNGAEPPPRVRHDKAPVTIFSNNTKVVVLDPTSDDEREASESAYDAAFEDMAPHVVPRAIVGCCNSLHCRDPEHEHHLDWTVMGDEHRKAGPAPANGRAARADFVPDPYTVSHFPDALPSIAELRHPRDDSQLRTAMSASPLDAQAMLLACARVHHTEAVNLRETYAREVDYVNRDINRELNNAYNADVLDRRVIRELRQARCEVLQTKKAIYVNTLRTLQLHIKRAIANILADCDVPQPPGVPMIALVHALHRVVMQYGPDCDERALAVALSMALRGETGDALDAQIDRIYAANGEAEPFVEQQAQFAAPPPVRKKSLQLNPAPSLDASAPSAAVDMFNREEHESVEAAAALSSLSKRRRVDTYDDEGALYYPCPAQSRLAPGIMPCTSIALHVARMLVRYCEQMPPDQVDGNLGSMFNQRVLWTGIENYRLWYDNLSESQRAMHSMQTYDEAVATLGGPEKCLQGLETRDYYGNVFDRDDVDANDELADAGVLPNIEALVDALQKSDALAKRQRAVFCVFTCSCESFVFGSAGGDAWWMFDSHDLDGNGMSVAGKFADASALKRYLTEKRYRDRRDAALEFSAVAISCKSK